MASKSSAIIGRIFIGMIWAGAIVGVILVLILIIPLAEVKLLPKTSHEEIVTVIEPSAIFSDIDNTKKTESVSFLIKFKNGKTKQVNFKGDVNFFKDQKMLLKYRLTMITKTVLVEDFKMVE